MKWTRRDFLRALAAMLGAAAPPPDGYKIYLPLVTRSSVYAADLGGGVWVIGNDLVEERIAFIGGGLFTRSFLHKASGRDWCASASSPVFFLEEEEAELTSADGWVHVESAALNSGDGAQLTVTVQHAARPSRAHSHFHVWSDAPVVRSWTEYENIGASARQLQAQSFCALTLGAAGALEVVWVAPFSWLSNRTDDSFVMHRETLQNPGQERHLVMGPYAAEDVGSYNVVTYRPSCGWFAFHQPGPGAGLFGGVEWSGACEAHLSLNDSGQGRVGIGHWRPALTHAVGPGESVTSPVAFVGLFEGALDEAVHLSHRLAKAHYIPARPPIRVPAGAEFPYVMADTWGYGPDIDEAGLGAFVDRAAEIGVEAVTIDEGWEARIGDWVSHPTRFPSGLRAMVDTIHSKGMAAGLWLAFANVDPASAVAQAHPDWLATQGGAPITGSFSTQVLCLSHPDARAWVAAEFDRIVAEFDVDAFVQDFETIARCDNPAHAAWHQAADSEYRNVLALWELIDGVRARHPNVMIENNWSGGRVMDFGMLRRYDTALCDDYNQAARNRGASFGVTHFFPPAFVSKYMGAEALPFDYQTRSYFFGGPWNLMTDLPAQDALMLAGAIGAYKELRELIRDGRVVHLVAPSFSGSGPNRYQISWDAIQAVESGMNRAVLLIGRGLAGPGAYNVRPQGLNPAKVYALAASSGANYGSRSGADLMANGIDVSLPERAHETIVLA